jgi:hypothetical protein
MEIPMARFQEIASSPRLRVNIRHAGFPICLNKADASDAHAVSF